MPTIANTTMTTAAVGNREELHNKVVMTDPEDTPVYSSTQKEGFDSKNPNWETVQLRTPAANVQEEGRIFTFRAGITPSRYETQTQILEESGIVSGTQQAVKEAGNVQKIARQKIMKGIQLRKDLEFALVSPQPTVAGTSRQFGGISTWATSNVSRGAGGANGGYNPATKLTVAPTNGTQRALTKALFDDMLEMGKKNGVNLKKAFLSTWAKRVFVTFMSDANVASFMQGVSKDGRNTIVGDAEIYRGPNGTVMVHENLVMSSSATTARNAIFMDQRYAKFGWLRKIHEPKTDINADATAFVIQGEGAFKPETEKGIGIIADIFGMSAAA